MPNPVGYSQHASGFWRKDSDASGPYVFDGTTIQLADSPYPVGATPQRGTSGNVANAAAVATLPAVAGKTTYCTGMVITGAGATAASIVIATVTGLLGGTAVYVTAVSAGAMIGNTPLVLDFTPALPASAVNTAITLSLPALGLGNTNAAVNLRGYTL